MWLRVTKQGNRYRLATSTDGQLFHHYREHTWGDGSVRRVGLVAKNGPGSNAPELDAVFDCFVVRPIPAFSDEILAPSLESPPARVVASGQPENVILTALDGRAIDLTGKVVFLNFWAPSAPMCEKEMAMLETLAAEHPNDLVVVGVSVETQDENAVRGFVKKHEITYPIILSNPQTLETIRTEIGGTIDTIPSTVIVGRDRRIKGKLAGLQSRETFEKAYRDAAASR